MAFAPGTPALWDWLEPALLFCLVPVLWYFCDSLSMDLTLAGNEAEDVPNLCGAELSLAGGSNALVAMAIR